jgi:hypothetical protein
LDVLSTKHTVTAYQAFMNFNGGKLNDLNALKVWEWRYQTHQRMKKSVTTDISYVVEKCSKDDGLLGYSTMYSPSQRLSFSYLPPSETEIPHRIFSLTTSLELEVDNERAKESTLHKIKKHFLQQFIIFSIQGEISSCL